MIVPSQQEVAERRGLRTPGARFFILLKPLTIRATQAAACLLLVMNGCEKTDETALDPHGFPPFASVARVDPDSVFMKNLPQNNGLLTVSVVARMNVRDPEGKDNIISVTATVIPPNGGDPLVQASMHDDGALPDSTGGDGVYAATLRFTVPKSATGSYRVQFLATDALGLESNLLDTPVHLIRNNAPPLLTELVAPDTVTVLAGDSVTFKMSVRVTDSDGQSDISSTYFRNLDYSDPNFHFILRDDGKPLISGDVVAGDGVFTITVTAFDSPTVRKTNRLLFQAVDAFGDTSASLPHSLTIR